LRGERLNSPAKSGHASFHLTGGNLPQRRFIVQNKH
jgi:hypothetical protein